ncbi:vomeronasal type-2 receptor 26-like [Pantherophis guttatus]|uniref:Vomeronasal type-2 receptor 26-like n=1 Tax=Pantherophis guttatus TaxID=94885 RepID=A0ABM3ZK25_PANGU|nr:vomeronasal type-2 receptor 26-like [Pantherophis guttatus]
MDSPVAKNYQHILAMAFAIKEINENPQILPNLTLGFHIYDSYDNAQRTYQATMLFLSSVERLIPNYSCNIHNNLVSVVGGLDAEISLHISTILDIYKIPQVFSSSCAISVIGCRRSCWRSYFFIMCMKVNIHESCNLSVR